MNLQYDIFPLGLTLDLTLGLSLLWLVGPLSFGVTAKDLDDLAFTLDFFNDNGLVLLVPSLLPVNVPAENVLQLFYLYLGAPDTLAECQDGRNEDDGTEDTDDDDGGHETSKGEIAGQIVVPFLVDLLGNEGD